MNHRFSIRYFSAFLLLCLFLITSAAQAQGPSIDPSFISPYAYRPASIQQATRQPDGKYLLLSDAVRVGGSATSGLVRLLANGTSHDPVFEANVSGLQGTCLAFTLLPNGQILLLGNGALTLGSVTRQQLLRLNADGTPDASFDAGSGVGFANIFRVVVQPNGKLLAIGNFMQFNGQTARRLVRLNSNGSLDTAFQTALGTGFNDTALALALQTDDKILVTGLFTSVNGLARPYVARLLPSGTVDTSFNLAVPGTTGLSEVAVQPDGKIVVGGYQTLRRLDANGATDISFQNGGGFNGALGTQYLPGLHLQPDGKIFVQTFSSNYNNTAISQLVRLLPDGGLDPTFANATAVPGNVTLSAAQLLANGQILVATTLPTHFAPASSTATGIALLNPDGSRDPAFVPVVQAPAAVNTVVRQADGKYVVGGNFTEIGGIAAGYVARLNADGTPDASFTAAAQASDEVSALALQPDGKILVAGLFDRLAGGGRLSLGRLLPSGALDAGFAPSFVPTPFARSNAKIVAVQNDGRVLVGGLLAEASAPLVVVSQLLCLNGTTGLRDTSFPATYFANNLVVQPDGNLLIAGSNNLSGIAYTLLRLLPSGVLDPAFVRTALPASALNYAIPLALDATGRIYAAGSFTNFGGLPAAEIIRLLPDGTPDPSFAAGFVSNRIMALAVQPNGRVLVGGQVGLQFAYGTLRLLTTGAPDASYASGTGPLAGVTQLLVQADGAILAAGYFTSVGGIPYNGLVRLLDANVLSVSSQQLTARTQAWPVPAHGQLHLRLDAASRPQRVELLDALGRVVLTQAISQPELTLDTTPLRTGAYVLRVQYASGPIMRRVVVE